MLPSIPDKKHLTRWRPGQESAVICVALLKLGMLHDDNFVPYAFLKLSATKDNSEGLLDYYRR